MKEFWELASWYTLMTLTILIGVETLELLTHERVLRVSLLVHTYDSHNPYWCSLWCTIPNVGVTLTNLSTRAPHECTCLIKIAHKSMWNFSQ
jgi:hypothetical protein